MCKSCKTCQEYQPQQLHQPRQQTEMPSRPWSVLGTDLFHVEGDQYLIIADIIQKARDASENEMLALLRWRTTPIDSTIQRPAEIMFQGKVKDTLPSKATNSIPNADEIKERMLSKQNIQKIYHDQKARLLPTLYPGMVATHRDVQTGKWSPATVLQKAHAPRYYIVQTSSGQVLRRNREHIREVPQSSDDRKLDNSITWNKRYSYVPSNQQQSTVYTSYVRKFTPGTGYQRSQEYNRQTFV